MQHSELVVKGRKFEDRPARQGTKPAWAVEVRKEKSRCAKIQSL